LRRFAEAEGLDKEKQESCVLVCVNPQREALPRSQQNSRNKIRSKEINVKRERLTQIVLVIVGLLNLALIYFLFRDLWHSSWLLEQKNEIEPMFLSFFIPAGVFLLMAARRPSEYRSGIALVAWWNISHGAVMAIQTVEAWIHSVHRNFTDVVIFLVIGVVLLALLPAKREVAAPGVA
jgi:hypothetical protein